MSDDVIIPSLIAIGFLVGFGIGVLAENSKNGQRLDECAKTHNVYQCEIIAVPLEKETG